MSKFITEEMMPAFQGVIPAVIATCSADGMPNVTYISQVYYLNEQHVALSRQFFNKTVRNIAENPLAQVVLTCPVTYNIYKFLLRFKESQASGPVFDEMALQQEVIAGMAGKSGIFNLQAADIYEILEINCIYPV